jgi:hypothetical protein
MWLPRDMLQFPDLRTFATSIGLAAACVAAAWLAGLFSLPQGWTRLLVGGGAMGACYLIGSLLLDPRLRALAMSMLPGRRGGQGAGAS